MYTLYPDIKPFDIIIILTQLYYFVNKLSSTLYRICVCVCAVGWFEEIKGRDYTQFGVTCV